MFFRALTLFLLLSISACSSWVYRLDIPQGNFIEPKDINKLQIAMTKEQVKFILGSPVIVDAFNKNTWHYVYRFQSGKKEELNIKRNFVIKFENDQVVSATGDYKMPESFYTPMQH